MLTRLPAALMPALLLWAFVGCAAVCSEHAEEARGEGASATSAELSDSNCPDPCPVTEAITFVPAKRFAPEQQAVGARTVAAPAAQEEPRAAPVAGRFSEVLRPPPDHPFERLRALRI